MKISVIVPVYNIEPYVEKCLDSIVNQTYKNLEIIIVDDGSTDNCSAICDKYAQKDSRVRVIHKENGGLVSARKAGVRCATGDYVSYVDGDDWIDIDTYEVLLKKMGNQEVDIVTFWHVREYKDKTVSRSEYFEEGLYTKEVFEQKLQEYYLEENYFMKYPINTSLWGKLIKRNIIQKYQEEVPNELWMCEDIVSYVCLVNSNNVLCLDNAFYHYNIRGTSMVNKRTNDEYKQILLLTSYMKQIVDIYPILRNFLIRMIYVWLLLMGREEALYDKKKISVLPNIKKGSRVFVYGKGNVGETLCHIMEKSGAYTIVGIVDSQDVELIATYEEKQYDYVIIATIIEEFQHAIEQTLIKMGIPQEKIMRIHPQDLQEENLPKEIRDILSN